ncbi:hypothetical protein [Celeribacter sp. ULVN23_4]
MSAAPRQTDWLDQVAEEDGEPPAPSAQPARIRTDIRFATETPVTETEREITTVALSFQGLGALSPNQLSETASWERTGAAPLVGRAPILNAQSTLTPPISLAVTQVVLQGKAATVSGRLTTLSKESGQTQMMFCHVLRFTSPARDQIAQVVSFQQEERL